MHGANVIAAMEVPFDDSLCRRPVGEDLCGFVPGPSCLCRQRSRLPMLSGKRVFGFQEVKNPWCSFLAMLILTVESGWDAGLSATGAAEGPVGGRVVAGPVGNREPGPAVRAAPGPVAMTLVRRLRLKRRSGPESRSLYSTFIRSSSPTSWLKIATESRVSWGSTERWLLAGRASMVLVKRLR